MDGGDLSVMSGQMQFQAEDGSLGERRDVCLVAAHGRAAQLVRDAIKPIAEAAPQRGPTQRHLGIAGQPEAGPAPGRIANEDLT